MDHDEEWLKSFIANKAEERWYPKKLPYYMNSIPIDTENEGVNYKDITHPYRLRQWLQFNKIPNTMTIFDENHKAKVTFIPNSADFTEVRKFLPNKTQIGYTDLGAGFTPQIPLNNSEALYEMHKSAIHGKELPQPSKKAPMSHERLATLRFLEVLSTLSDDEIEEIKIPLKTIVRLLAK